MRILLLLLLVLGLSPSTVYATTAVAHAPQVQIDRAAIRLSDVFPSVPATLDTEIALAPLPGRSVTYDYGVLSKLAQRYALDWQARSLSDQCLISRAATRITTGMINEAVLQQLRAQGVQGELEVLFDQRGLELNLPARATADFTLHDFSYDRSNQRFRAELMAAADTPDFLQVAVTGRVASVVAVPVLNKPLEQGALISKSDLDWIKLPADRAADYLRQESDLVGMEVRRQMAVQAAMRPQDLSPPRVVRRGNLVTMQIITAQLQLTAQGRALQDGAVGDVIRVTNTQSNRVIDAKVVGAGVVEVTMTKLASLP